MFYNYKLIFCPVSRLFPGFAYTVNRRVENRGPGFLANGYIAFYCFHVVHWLRVAGLENGVNGMLVPFGDPDLMADALGYGF